MLATGFTLFTLLGQGTTLALANKETLVMAGGVSANYLLRHQLERKLQPDGVSVHYPSLRLCTDNGAMIAYAGALRLAAGQRDPVDAEVRARWPMTELSPPEAA